MIGSRRKDLKLQRKKYPVNTSAYFLLNSHTGEEGAPNAKTVTTKIGLTMDFFLFNPIVFLQTNFGIFNYQGNAFTNVGVGLGAEF